ncbi:MAG: hypothetical protein A2033_04090 [Bacteroidetes bacterium GWA2_31_9]|nr:MAG: hypothetical protein A2033_04090 [Bacteroidetes bacterium GWA2_31_9]
MIKSPFVFGKVASNSAFINRELETQKLKNNFISGINTTLISPRRWGKTSLVKKAASELAMENTNIKICYIDLFGVKDEEEFYEIWIREIIKASSSKWNDWLKTAKEILKGIVPSFSFGIDPQNDFSVKLNLEQAKKNISDIIELPEKIAIKKGIKYIICIDEFQKIAKYNDSLNFQQYLRSKWQHFNNTSFCIYGSKRHIITDIFESQSMPFYRFGDMIYLKKINEIHWQKYLSLSFSETNKSISDDIINRLIAAVKNHPYHIQQLAHQIWINTNESVTDKIFNDSIDELLTFNEIMYIREIDDLSALQISFIEAIANNEKKLTSKEVISKYKFGTTGNIHRLKKAIESKEIIDLFENKPEFIDPLFELWFKSKYLKM